MNIESNAFKVKIYCTTDHIVLRENPDSQEAIWADTGFYHEDDEGVKRSRGISVTKGPTPPYMSGAGTFTKLGEAYPFNRVPGLASELSVWRE